MLRGAEGPIDSGETADELRTLADELERASLLIRVAARACRAGSHKAASQMLLEAAFIAAAYADRVALANAQ